MYYLIKQEECDCNDDQMRENWDGAAYPCDQCTRGYIETRIDADEWFRDKMAVYELSMRMKEAK